MVGAQQILISMRHSMNNNTLNNNTLRTKKIY